MRRVCPNAGEGGSSRFAPHSEAKDQTERKRSAEAACSQPEERNMHANLRKVLIAASMICAASPVLANVITDWDEKAIAAVTPLASLSGTSPYMAQRMMAMIHVAMF